MNRRGLTITATMAAVVAVDAITKAVAVHALAGGDVPLGGNFRLTLLYHGGAGHFAPAASAGWMAVVVSIVALVALRMGRDLFRVDRFTPLCFGLLLGAGAANLADTLLGGAGVVDFIAFDRPSMSTVFNVADLAVGAGLLLCVRTVVLLAMAIIENRPRVMVRASTSTLTDVEVPLQVVDARAEGTAAVRRKQPEWPRPSDDRSQLRT